jgi:hypothetical protein
MMRSSTPSPQPDRPGRQPISEARGNRLAVSSHWARLLVSLGVIGLSSALVFPLGFFMGMPFPKGALRVGELIDWGFAVNGVASVLGATAVVVAGFTFGFNAALLGAGALYAAAMALLSMKARW